MLCTVNLNSGTTLAPLTEVLAFRASMIPLLLCGGIKAYAAMFLCPVFFSLANLNHLLDTQQKGSLLKASMVVGFQIGCAVVFGSYFSLLFIRAGHLTAPLVAHLFCNSMGLPVIYSQRTGLLSGIYSWDGGFCVVSVSANYLV